jgi:hypothetical protein
MKTRIQLVATIVFFLLGHFWASAQITAIMALDSTDILIGDRIGMSLTIGHSPRVRLDPPSLDSLRKIPDLEVVDEQDWKTEARGDELVLEKRLILQAFDSGTFVLPPLALSYTLDGTPATATSNSATLRVRPFPLAADKDTTISDIKPIMVEPATWEDWKYYIYGGIVLLLLDALMLYFLIRPKKAQQKTIIAKPIIKEPAAVVALRKLKELEGKALWQKGEMKAYYSELSFILREYLENRYETPALESTTDEIMQALSKQQVVGKTEMSRLGDVLQTSDMVKFAKATPSEATHQQCLADAIAFVEATKPTPPVDEKPE